MRRAASLHLTPPGSREPVPYSTVSGARRQIDSLDAISVFEVAVVGGGADVRLERRIEGLDLRTSNLIMRIAEGTPYRYPRQLYKETPWPLEKT